MVDNKALLVGRFSSVQLVDLYTWFISPELVDKLMVDLACCDIKDIRIIGKYHGSLTLLCDTIRKINVVDIASMYGWNYRNDMCYVKNLL